jgi:putative membrane protein
MTKRNPIQYALLTLKGMAMGAADVVPGVSGGTIAFISGIYEELISSINNVNLEAIRVLKRDGVKAAWNHVNGTFLLFLLTGIAISILSLSKLVLYLLAEHPILIWSFFFGLVVASSWLVSKSVSKWNSGTIVSLIIGVIIAFFISSAQTVAAGASGWYIFLSGAIAICAMILPGISGSFILVLMGSYHIVLNALHDRDFALIGLFASGCLVGILSFARLLKFLFAKFKAITVALLTGFMIGSLYKVWPWKVNVGSGPIVVHSDGREDWMTTNVLPGNFEGEALLWQAIICLLVGFLFIVVLERFAPKEK